MKRVICVAVFLVALAIPNIASAHTGTVKCDSTGVVFSYNNNFAHDTLVTESVKDSTQGNGTVYSVTVPANKAFTHTVPAPSNSVIASAVWTDGYSKGSIGPTIISCPVSPVKTPPVCPLNTVNEGVSNGVLVCVRTVTNTLPAPPPITVTVIKTVPEDEEMPVKCPKWAKPYRVYDNMTLCIKTHIIVKWKTRIKMIPYTPNTAPVKNHKGVGGVTG